MFGVNMLHCVRFHHRVSAARVIKRVQMWKYLLTTLLVRLLPRPLLLFA